MNPPIITPVIVPVRSHPHEDPKCPHCHAKLKGWSEPCDVSGWFFLSFMLFIFFLIGQGVAGFVGALDGGFGRCDTFGEKRYHYVIPTYYGGCVAYRWLANKDFIFQKDYEAYEKQQEEARDAEWKKKWGNL